MDTQKLDNNQAPKKKGVKASTVAMAGAGVAAAGIVGVAALADQDQTQQEELASNQEEETQQEELAETNEQEELLAQNQNQQPSQPQHDNITEPTPIAPDEPGTPSGHVENNTTEVVVEVDPVDSSEAEALAIAQHIVGEDEIDINDIDAPSMAFLDTDVIYDENGSEIPVALVSMPDSDEPFLLADIDGDRVYDYMVDTNGNIVGYMGNALNVDDAEFALTSGNGYLAVNENDIHLIDDEDISEDIMVLGDDDLLANVDYTHEAIDMDPNDGYEEPDVVLADSEPLDDIMSDISYDAPEEG